MLFHRMKELGKRFVQGVWGCFKHYYISRGKEEVKSFLHTFFATFLVVFGTLAEVQLNLLQEGIVTKEIFISLGAAAGSASIRSFFKALIFAFFPGSNRFQVTGQK